MADSSAAGRMERQAGAFAAPPGPKLRAARDRRYATRPSCAGNCRVPMPAATDVHPRRRQDRDDRRTHRQPGHAGSVSNKADSAEVWAAPAADSIIGKDVNDVQARI